MPLTWVWPLAAWATAKYDPRRLPVQAVIIAAMFGVLIMLAGLPTVFRVGGLAFAVPYVVIQTGPAAVVFARASRPRVVGAVILVLAAPLMVLLPPVLVFLTAAPVLAGIAAADAVRARGEPLQAPSPPG